MKTLNVFLYNHLAGTLYLDNLNKITFKYDSEYLQLYNATPLSLSMPLINESYSDEISRPFFAGLLPEGSIIKQIAYQLNTETDNILNLLEVMGGDCAGAISFYPQDIDPMNNQQEGIVLNEEDLFNLILRLKDDPLLVKESSMRVLISGSQSKLPVSLIDDQITLMKGNYPTTHILKLPLLNEIDTLQNEMFCLKLAQLAGFKVPKHSLGWSKNLPYLIIERYDRKVEEDGSVVRLHQEDFCQAMSILPINKDETSGGPSIKSCLDLIDANAKQPAADKITFLKLMIFNYLIGNSEIHGKNLSFVYKENKLSLAPVYNLFSNSIYSKLSPKMTMTIDGKFYPNLIRMDNWHKIVANNSTAKKMIEKELKKMAIQIPKLAERLAIKINEEGNTSVVYDQIISMIHKRSKHIMRYTQLSSDKLESKFLNPNYTFEKISPPVGRQSKPPYMVTDQKNHTMQTSRESLNPAVSLNTQKADKGRKRENISPKSTFEKLFQPAPYSKFEPKVSSNKDDLSIQTPSERLSPPVSNAPTDVDKKESISPDTTFNKLPHPKFESKVTSKKDDLSIPSHRKPLLSSASNTHSDVNKKESISPKSTFDKLYQPVVPPAYELNSISDKEDLPIQDTYIPLSPAVNSEPVNIDKKENISPKSTFGKLLQPPNRRTYKPDSFSNNENSPESKKQDDKKNINPKSTFSKIFKDELDNKNDK